MFRFLIALGTVLLDLLTVFSEGTVSMSLMVIGCLLTCVHLTMESSPFRGMINWLTGCSLPESMDSPETGHAEESARVAL